MGLVQKQSSALFSSTFVPPEIYDEFQKMKGEHAMFSSLSQGF